MPTHEAAVPLPNRPAPADSAPMLDVGRQNGPLRDELLAAFAEVLDTGAFLKGPAVTELEDEVARRVGVRHAIGCASGSDAILVALMSLGIGPGDEVIVPSFTFFATAGSVWRLGARPVFADVLPDTLNLDPSDVARRVTPATKAIMPVHLFGQSADMTALANLADACGVPLVEDAAQAIGASHRGRAVGSLGRFGCFSFYPTKNLGGFGDGGMITTDDDTLAAAVRALCDHGQQPRYHHHVVGLNSRLDTLQAAGLVVKLRHLDEYADARRRHAARYAEALAAPEFAGVVDAPTEAPGCPSVWNQYTVRVRHGRRDALQAYLGERRVGAAIYYPVPLHLQACFAELGGQPGDLPVSEQAAHEVLSLPVYPEMLPEEQQLVIDTLREYAVGVSSTRRLAA